jgi:hypothetical protein
MAPDDDRDVLSSLPRTRPQRRSAKRAAPVKAPPKAARPAKSGKAPAKPAATRKATARPRGKAASRTVPPAGFAVPGAGADQAPPSGAELVGTAVQAAGELVQIGLAVGEQALRSALGRLRRP